MKTLSVIIAGCLAASGAAATQATAPGQHRVLTKISHQTGVPVHTLRREKAKTGLGFGALEKANLLAKATGHSFRQVVSRFRSGEGWGKIAHDAGLNLGKLVSRAHRSDKATRHSHIAHAQRADADRDRHERDREDRARDDRARDDRAHAQNTHGRSSVHRGSTIAHGSGHPMNGFGHGDFGRGGFGQAHGGAMHGMGHGHGGR